jgi:hypothetical protein
LLGTPDLSAAVICALPLGASATRWRELLLASIGLAVGFLAAHFFIVVLHREYPPSLFYWVREQAIVLPFSIATIAYALILVFAARCFVRFLWQGEYPRAGRYLLLTLALLAAVLGPFAYLVVQARAFEGPATEVLGASVSPSPEMIVVDCIFPPFGEGLVGYAMLAVVVIFEILVAVGIAGALNTKRMPNS